jgi:single-stranded-DNA-specific exonuclease
MEKYVWKLAAQSERAEALASALGLPRPIAQVLLNRGLADEASARTYLEGTLDDLHDPFRMAGMAEAVDRIFRAIASGETVLIFGDYDVDGVLSVIMLRKALETLGARVDHFVPERLKDGYGIKDEHVAVAAERGAKLVISVDCGIKANGFVRGARERGIDCLVTDHHLPGEVLPEALALLDPVLPTSGYPDRNLAGVGVVFKLIQALFARAGKMAQLPHYLKLVAIGTVADIVELRGENRLFVKFGLKNLRDISNIGLRALIEESGVKGPVTEGDIGFRIGPRINAAGRMGETHLALDLFFTKVPDEARAIARRLSLLNSRRQSEEDKIYAEAFERITANSWDRNYRILILGSETWHRGVIGIVASKLKEAFTRPVLLFSYENGKAFGSGRSISEFSLIDCLEECRSHVLTYGGHKYAVGCSLLRENMPAFKQAANAIAGARITDDEMRPKISIDAPLRLADLDDAFVEALSSLGPFGVGNPRPVFLVEAAEVAGPPRILKDKHLKIFLKDTRSGTRVVKTALGWGKAAWADIAGAGRRVDAVFTVQTSSFLGADEAYLSLEDLRPAGP